jgi:general secretion pathway protein N
MGRLICCIILAVVWSFPLSAEDRLPNERSALPWLKLGALAATRDRPLFTPARRKPAPPPVLAAPNVAAPPQESQPAREPQLALEGIIVDSSETLILLRDASTSESITIRPGEPIGKWHVFVESSYSVILKNGDEQFRLEIFAEP